MKVYTKIVINIEDGRPVVVEGYDYAGPVAELKGAKAAKPVEGAAGRITAHLYTPDGKTPGPLQGALRNILSNTGDDPFTQRQLDLLTQRTRMGFGARGTAGSGIAQQSEQDVQKDFLLNRGEQKQNQAIQILGTSSSSPQVLPGKQGSGIFGLK